MYVKKLYCLPKLMFLRKDGGIAAVVAEKTSIPLSIRLPSEFQQFSSINFLFLTQYFQIPFPSIIFKNNSNNFPFKVIDFLEA